LRDLRFARAAIRAVAGGALLFVSEPVASRVGFGDLGMQSLAPAPGVARWARGYCLELVAGNAGEEGLGEVVLVRAARA
jgi:hypothetical protein